MLLLRIFPILVSMHMHAQSIMQLTYTIYKYKKTMKLKDEVGMGEPKRTQTRFVEIIMHMSTIYYNTNTSLRLLFS